MKFFVKNTTINTNKHVKDSNIVCISDLHYTKSLTSNFLVTLTQKIEDLNPTYICFLGDLCDDNSYSEVIEWLNNLAKISPVYFIYGNHDIKKYRIKNEMYKVQSHLPSKICKEIKNINNLKVIDNNKIITNDGYSFCGVDFFDDSHYNSFIKKMNANIPDFNINYFNSILSHNPKIIDPLIFNKLDKEYKVNTDCILSGHSHNGLVTPTLDKLMPGNRGFYIKAKGLFPTFTRGVIDCEECSECQYGYYTGIICPPLRTLPDRNVFLYKANNILYNPGIQLVRIKKEN